MENSFVQISKKTFELLQILEVRAPMPAQNNVSRSARLMAGEGEPIMGLKEVQDL